MDSVQQTLKRSRQIDERFKKFMENKAERDLSIEQTLKRIDRTQATLQETKETIGQIDNLYGRLQQAMSDSIDQAVKSIEKSTLLTVAEPGFQPNRASGKKIADMLKDKKKILVLTGAGISAASGIPTFRGDGGFWKKEAVEFDPQDPSQKLDPQVILTNLFYSQHPSVTWKWLQDFYHLKIKAKPNKGHQALQQILSELARKGKNVCLVTQNIDNYHVEVHQQNQKKNKNFKAFPIHEIHGNILKIRCNHCSKEESKLVTFPYQMFEAILEMKSKLFCQRCQGPLRPHIMFFDQFYEEVYNSSDTIRTYLKEVDAVLVIGTALQTGLANQIVQSAVESEMQVVQINTTCQIRKSKVWWAEGKADTILQQIKLNIYKK